LASTESSSIDVPEMKTGKLFLYLDMKDILPGNYTLQTETIFGEGKKIFQQFNISVADKEEIGSPEDNKSRSFSGNIFVYSLLVVIMISLAAIIYLLSRKRKEEEF
jgi:hypothetical protein